MDPATALAALALARSIIGSASKFFKGDDLTDAEIAGLQKAATDAETDFFDTP